MKNKILLLGISLLTVLFFITGCGAKEFEITFDTAGGSYVNEQTVKKNETVVKPKDPTKTGYTFDEWMYENDTYDFNSKVTKNITLKATWNKNKDEDNDNDDVLKTYTVKFDTAGGSAVKDQMIKHGEKVVLPAEPKRSGYTFVKWSINNETYDFNSAVMKDMTIKAIWKQNDAPVVKPEKNKYTVKFDSAGGSAIGSQLIIEGNKVSQPGNPTKDGSTFLHWTLNGNTYDFNSAVNKNITLVAVWKVNPVVDKYTLSLGLINNDKSSVERLVIVYKNGTAIQVAQLLNQEGKILGNYHAGLKGIRVNKDIYEASSSYKVKLTDGTIIDIK